MRLLTECLFLIFVCTVCVFFLFFMCACLPTPNLLAAARSKATGKRASPAALPGHPAHRARIPPAPHSHPPAGQEPSPRGQWARHTVDAQRQHPAHPVHPLNACPGSQQQHAGVWGASGAARAGACLREPWSRERFRFLRGWKWTDWGRSSHSCRSGGTEWDCLRWSLFYTIFISFLFNFLHGYFSTKHISSFTPTICKSRTKYVMAFFYPLVKKECCCRTTKLKCIPQGASKL